MSAFSLSDLLNPAPLSQPTSPRPHDVAMQENALTTVAGDEFAPELFQGDSGMDGQSLFEQPTMPILEHSSSPEFTRKDSMTSNMVSGMDTIMEDDDDGTPSTDKKKERSTKRDPEKAKDTKHSSKNEGQHTDRRYLCYVCHKLFTRRRSVRDHLNKIHGEKTWEPTKSLEIVVEPHTGEPIEPIEELIARGPPAPPPRSKPPKSVKESTKEEPQDNPNQEDVEDEIPLAQQAMQKLAVQQAQQQSQDLDVKPPRISAPVLPAASPNVDQEPSTEPEKENDPEPEPEPEPTAAAAPVKLKKEESQLSSRPTSVEPSASVPAQLIGKKRPLPMGKKGTAKIKSSTPSKRLKLSESERSTPARSPSVTPAQKTASKLKKPLNVPSPSSRASSRQASASPTPSAATVASSNDDGEIFCICRKGDNHTWMIACDGPCEEWFHGKCVGIRERDGELIDKYICPHCTKEGFITTWKRMCRRPDCRKPARVKDNPPSKYCSLECGRMFFVELIKRGDADAQSSKDGQFIIDQPKEKKLRKKVRRDNSTHTAPNGIGTPSRPHTPAYSEDERSEYETDSSMDDDELPNRGGALRAGEVKALLQQCRSVDSWHELGKKPETPPRELDEKESSVLVYDDFESVRVASLRKELADLDEKLHHLSEREKFLDLIKSRSTTIVDEFKKSNPKLKSVCGYDPRAAWNAEQFLLWYNKHGKQTLQSGKIGPPSVDEDHDGDVDMAKGVDSDNDEDEKAATTTKGGMCIRNNCPKHGRTWQKNQLAELRFEQDLVKKKQDNLAHQEHEIRSRAQIRALEQGRKAP